jgi:hypothetical protein
MHYKRFLLTYVSFEFINLDTVKLGYNDHGFNKFMDITKNGNIVVVGTQLQRIAYYISNFGHFLDPLE